jgi:release factor glutamine methyltransferase
VTDAAALFEEVSSRLGSISEARWIVADVTGVDPGLAGLAPQGALADSVVESARDMVRRRLAGEPLQYVLGRWGFRMLEVVVDRRVLIPRPETEQVVGNALSELSRIASAREHATPQTDDPFVVVDLCTGSGVIALSLAVEGDTSGRPLEVWATDSSRQALEVAGENLRILGTRTPDAASRVRLSDGDLFDALPESLAGHVALIVSNPPYVSAKDWSRLEPSVRDHEPKCALVAGDKGTEILEAIFAGAPEWLSPDGSLVVEISPEQEHAVCSMASSARFATVEVRPDLSGRPRALVARRRPADAEEQSR